MRGGGASVPQFINTLTTVAKMYGEFMDRVKHNIDAE